MFTLKMFLLVIVPLSMLVLFFKKKDTKETAMSPEQNLRALTKTARRLERIQDEQEVSKLTASFEGATVSANNPLTRSSRGF